MTNWAPTISDGSEPLYLRLADALAADVRRQRLKGGDRLPTHRELASHLGVTVGTVTRGYAEAARRGLISGEVGRGTYVRAQRTAPVSQDDSALVDLSVNHPPALEPECEGMLQQTLVQLASDPRLGRLLEYGPTGGLPAHRRAGARWIVQAGLDASPANVLVASGSQHALTAILAALIEPGDTVLVESLTYPGMRALCQLLGVRVEAVPIDDLGLIPEAFEAACRKRRVRLLYCIPTVHNPTGSVLPEDRRREVAKIAQRHGVVLIEDDVHGLLLEHRPPPITAFAPDVGIYLSSTAKTLAPGFRVAFLSAPPPLVQPLAASLRTTTWTVAPLMAEVVARWIEDGTAERVVATRREQARSRSCLYRSILPDGLGGNMPEVAALHVWLGLPEQWSSESFADTARAQGVAVTSAHAFMVARGVPPRAVRVCLGAARDEHQLGQALGVLARLLRGRSADPPLIV